MASPIECAPVEQAEELQDARWVTREELVSAFAGTHPLIKPSRVGAIARFLMDHWLADRLD